MSHSSKSPGDADPQEPLPRPKRRIAPAVFYQDYLPELWQAAALRFNVSPPQKAAHLLLRIGEESLHLALGPNGFALVQAPDDTALFTVTSTLEAWRSSVALVLPAVLKFADNTPDSAAVMLKQMCDTLASDARLQQLATLAGAVKITWIDDAGDPHDFVVAVTAGSDVRAHITVSDADLQNMLDAGGIKGMVLQSRLRIEGDAGYVLRLAQWGAM